VEVSIQDNGRGIPAEVLDKVYSPFYTTKARGMGLGLPIVKRTVIDHNGRLTIDSNGPGTHRGHPVARRRFHPRTGAPL
jgi:signal transduction histidine kinase